VNYLYESPIFEENRKDLIKKGIEEYLNGNYIVALHILIPQIERRLETLRRKQEGLFLSNQGTEGSTTRLLRICYGMIT